MTRRGSRSRATATCQRCGDAGPTRRSARTAAGTAADCQSPHRQPSAAVPCRRAGDAASIWQLSVAVPCSTYHLPPQYRQPSPAIRQPSAACRRPAADPPPTCCRPAVDLPSTCRRPAVNLLSRRLPSSCISMKTFKITENTETPLKQRPEAIPGDRYVRPCHPLHLRNTRTLCKNECFRKTAMEGTPDPCRARDAKSTKTL